MRATKTPLGMLMLAAAVAMPLAACKKGSDSRRGKRTVKASISNFDENEDIVLDLSAYGTERPDAYRLEKELESTYEELDKCVADTKDRHNMGDSAQLKGGVEIAIKLVGNQTHPEAVNVALTSKKWDKDQKLVGCIHDAIADNYRIDKYDGPPVVMKSELDELDPGFEVEDDWW